MKITLYNKSILAVCIFFVTSLLSIATTSFNRIAEPSGITEVQKNNSATAALAPGMLISDTSICYGGSSGVLSTYPATGGCGTKANKSYQWQSSTDGVGYSNISGATNSSYTAVGLTTTTYYKRIVTDICAATAETAPVKITVLSAPTTFSAGTIGSNSTICSGSSTTLTNVAVASGGYAGATIAYQWFSNASGSYVSIAGATNSTYTTPSITSTVSFRRYATSTSACGSFNGYSNVVAITVANTLPAPATISGTYAQCPGYSNVVFSASGVTGADSYVWTLPAGVTAVSGETTRVITVNFANSYTGGTLSCAAVNVCGNGATVSAALTVGACDWVWTGSTSTNWSTASNWSRGSIPATTSNVIIPNVTNKPVISSGTTAKANIMTINSGATLTLNGTATLLAYGDLTNFGTIISSTTAKIQTAKNSGTQTFTGDLTGIKYLLKATNATLNLGSDWVVSGRIDLRAGTINVNSHVLTFDVVNGGYVGYTSGDAGSITGDVTVTKPLGQNTHNIASPLSGVTATQINDDFQVINPINSRSRLNGWNSATQKWSTGGLPLSTALNRGSAFNFFCSTSGNLDFTGGYTQTATPFVLTSSANAAGAFCIFGNPYLADLNWDNIGKTNVDATVYYWNQSAQAYATYTTGGASSNGGTIQVPVMQGFFVTATASGTASISVGPTAIINSAPTSTFYRTASPSDKFNLIVKDNEGKSDEVSIVISEDATTDFDGSMDAYKLVNPGTSLNMFTTLGNTDYAVNNIPASATDQCLALSFAAPASGTYTIESANVDLSTVNVFLKDKTTGTITPIDALPYTFTAESTDASERFDIMFRTATTTSTQTAAATAGVSFASFQKDLVILNQSLQMGNATIVVSDLSGNVVKTISGVSVSSNATFNLSDLSAGMYMIKLVDQVNGNTYSGKISIQ